MMSLPPIYRKYAYQWRVSQVVLVYGLHRLYAWSCQLAKSVDVNRPAELQLPRLHSVEQPAVCSARRQTFTEHVLAAAEGFCLDSNAHHHPAPLRRFVTLAPCINVMTYLLTYFGGYSKRRRHLVEICPQNLLKVGVNRQFQAKMPIYENRCISKTVNPIKPKFEDKAESTTSTCGWATITLNQIQHGRRPPS